MALFLTNKGGDDGADPWEGGEPERPWGTTHDSHLLMQYIYIYYIIRYYSIYIWQDAELPERAMEREK